MYPFVIKHEKMQMGQQSPPLEEDFFIRPPEIQPDVCMHQNLEDINGVLFDTHVVLRVGS